MNVIKTEENCLNINNSLIAKNKYDVTKLSYGVRLSNGVNYFDLKSTETEVDGDVLSTDDLFNFFLLQGFSIGGGSESDGAVESVTGDLVDNTNPSNPKVNMPVLDEGDFLVGGASGNEQRTILPTDIGLTKNNTVAVRNSSGNLQGWAMSSSAESSTIPVRTPSGQGKFTPATSPDEAVVLSQLNSSLESKVDKEAGKVLSEENFTTDEKTKLSGLESPKFKGQFLSLADLNSADVGEEGGYAYVDGGEGGTVDLYIWDAVNSLWEVVAGESTAETPASIKSKYESNPDTNAFTDALKNKLEAFTANFTSALKTAYDNASSWISANGANILNHLSNTNNPHNVTAAQLGIVGLENLGKAWIPDYANMETTNRITSSGGSWTSDRKGFVYVLSRGYNASIYNTVVVTINGKEVGRVWVEATSGSGSARSGSFSNVYPVKPGDVVTVTGNLETKCLFTPGVWA